MSGKDFFSWFSGLRVRYHSACTWLAWNLGVSYSWKRISCFVRREEEVRYHSVGTSLNWNNLEGKDTIHIDQKERKCKEQKKGGRSSTSSVVQNKAFFV